MLLICAFHQTLHRITLPRGTYNMTTEQFRASVQYGDFEGTAAADRADKNNADKWLDDRGLKRGHEFLVGLTLVAGENHGVHKDPVSIRFLLAGPGDHDTVKAAISASNGAFSVRCVHAEMPIAEFLGLFKRLSIYVSNHSILEGKEYSYKDE
jgi:hypothetical protein